MATQSKNAKLLETRLKELGLSRMEAAKLTDISQPLLSRLINDKYAFTPLICAKLDKAGLADYWQLSQDQAHIERQKIKADDLKRVKKNSLKG